MTAAAVQWVELDRITEEWVSFVDPQGLVHMEWATVRRLHDVANGDAGHATHKGRRFDRDVLAAVVRAIDDAPKCRRSLDGGRSECGRLSDPTSAAGWCRTCQRSA